MAPLQRLGAIKLKLGALLVGGVVLTALIVLTGAAIGLSPWLTVLIAVAAALVAVELLGSGLTAPLRQMARQAERLAGGQVVEPVDEGARDEVGDLARAFNRMAADVARTDRVRRELVANVSHELRTPLAALTAVLENLIDGVEAASADSLGRMEAQTDRLRSLVDQLLDLSQLDAGAVTLALGPVPVAALVREVVAGLDHAGGERVLVEVADDLVAPLDRDRFAQVLVNLVGNALRHGPDDTPVTVTAATVGGRLSLTVADEGPGISPADAERVFDRFARSDEGRTADAGGAGLGLAITRWIVELHDGQVRVDLPGEPGGRLTVEVPMDTMPPPAVPTPPAAASAAPAPAPGGADVLRLLPTPIAGLRWRGLIAALTVGVVVALLLPVADTSTGSGFTLGMALALVSGAVGTMLAVEGRLDRYGLACAGIATTIGAAWAFTDAAWTLIPVTFGAVLLAGLGVWGPRSFGEHMRALVVGPILMLATPVAIARTERGERGDRPAMVVPIMATILTLLVFGSLLAGVDGVFAELLGRMLPDIDIDATLVFRVIVGAFASLLVVTYVLVQRAGSVPTPPWARPVRPRLDWAIPVGALDLLFLLFVVLQVRVLFGGDALVLQTTGLTYAEHARSGFGQLLLVTLLTLAVIGAVVRVADDAHRRTRDLLLGGLVALTFVMLASALQRLLLYVDAFGLTRLRVVGLVILVWVAIMLVLVALAGRLTAVASHLPRTAVLVTGVLALGLVLSRPDAIIASTNLARYERTGSIDLWELRSLSADAAPAILSAGLDAEQLADVLDRCHPDVVASGNRTVREPSAFDWNFSARAADRAYAAAGCV